MAGRKTVTAPFPYFGGKGAVAPLVWKYLGDVDRYIEPFCGSAAVLLARPVSGNLGRYKEMINDKAGFVSNFWRAIKDNPEALAKAIDWPINEVDLYARQKWLVERAVTLTAELERDPFFYDVQAAAWWAWGASCWIGSNWATDGRRAKPNMTPRGVNRLALDLWYTDGYSPINEALRQYLLELSTRLRQVRVLCGDWKRCVKPSELTAGRKVGVFLDPPYTNALRDDGLYYHDAAVTKEVEDFCRVWGSEIKIVLAGYEGEYDLPLWRLESWAGKRAFSSVRKTANNTNRMQERLWISPACRVRYIKRTVKLPV